MATRNLTLDFVRLRSRSLPTRGTGAGHGGGAYDMRPLVDGSTDVEAGAASAVGGPGAGVGGLPPKYVDIVTDVQAEIKGIEDKMKRLDAVHRQRLTVTFDDTQEAALERDIDVLTREITRHFQSAGGLLKQVAPGGDRSADANVRRNIQRSNAAHLQQLSGDFRKAQKAYLGRLRAKKEGTGPDLLGSAGGAGGEASTKDVDLGFSEAQRAETDMLEESSRERDTEIRKIAKNIEELAVIFKELATLIIDQGTVLDRIDYNMDMVVERTREGLKELEKAEEYQKSARPKKCIAFLLIMITIMVIVLILKKQ